MQSDLEMAQHDLGEITAPMLEARSTLMAWAFLPGSLPADFNISRSLKTLFLSHQDVRR